jgi:hypothetical protein
MQPAPDPQADPSLWVAADPIMPDADARADARPAVPAPTGHRVPADVDFDELMQRHGLSPLFVADHVVYRKTKGRSV